MANVKDPDPPTTTATTDDKPTDSGVETTKDAPKKPAEGKSAEVKPAEWKSAEVKPAEYKPVEEKTTDEKNAAAAADVQNLLAELKAEGSLDQPAAEEITNGVEKVEDSQTKPTSESTEKPEEKVDTKAAPQEKESRDSEGKSESKYDSRDRRGGYHRGSGARDLPKRKDYQANVKTDFSKVKESSDHDEIRKQVEFYFSDSNLPMDKFLLSKVGGAKNLPVELSIIHSFKRMRHFQPFSAIAEALKSSSVLELTDNDTAVKRKVPLPEAVTDNPDRDTIRVFEDAAMARSVYVKGFGDEQPSTQFDIEAFFAPYGPTNAIRLRRSQEKVFKGSVFVEFDSEEGQKSFLALDPKPKYKDNDLLIKSKKRYCDEKAEDIKAGRIKAGTYRHPGHGGDGRGEKRKADGDDRDWRERRDEDRKSGFRDRDRDGRDSRDSRDGRDRRGRGGHRGFGSRGGRGGGRQNHNPRDSRYLPGYPLQRQSNLTISQPTSCGPSIHR